MQRFAFLLALTAGSLASCATPEKAPVEQAGYRSAGAVITAIDKFHADHGRYPARLQELVPHYLRQVHQVAVFDIRYGDLQGFEYYPKRDRYSLNFVYYTFGDDSQVRCYDSKSRTWEKNVITW
jgi:DMSO/TMAO reductase YedYZ molybdopterin-dependent catalytic subunit